MKLPAILFAVAFVLTTTAASAQGTMPDPKTFASSADVETLVAKAKAMPPQAMILLNIVTVGPYKANLEYRASPNQQAVVHPKEDELIYIVDGAGTFNMGGAISGEAITGGTSQHVAKGDVLFVPSNTPHQMIPDGGGEAHMSFHVPAPGAGTGPQPIDR